MMKLVVLSCILAAVAGTLITPLSYTTPLGITSPLGIPSPLGIATPLAIQSPLAYTAPLLTPSNYRGPLSLAPGQPANIIAADGRPLDTLDVNLDRSAHIIAKSLSGTSVHVLKKRSVAPVIAPLAVSRVAVASTPLLTGSSIASVPFVAGNINAPVPLVAGNPLAPVPLIARSPIAPVPLVTGNSVVPVPLAASNPLAYSSLIPSVVGSRIVAPISIGQAPRIQL